ncbi:MAG: YIP1 family protein [Candidatus Obscuribacterales bacterium]|nr:YIP1 family protein [Candidatus Obscuribacterales bacterium]
MDSEIQTDNWWKTTTRILFSPRTFFKQLQGPFSYRKSVTYLAKTALVASLVNTILLTLIFYLILASFASILSASTLLFGILLTPLIAVAANIPPEKVPTLLESFARNGGIQVAIMSARFGAFLFLGYFGTITIGTIIQAGIAHGIARLFGSAAGFRVTATIYSYGSAAWMLSVIPIVNLLSSFYAAVLIFFGMRQLHELSGVKAIFALVMAAAVPLILAFIISS